MTDATPTAAEIALAEVLLQDYQPPRLVGAIAWALHHHAAQAVAESDGFTLVWCERCRRKHTIRR